MAKRAVNAASVLPVALMNAHVRLMIVHVALTINRVALVNAASVAISRAPGVIADQTTDPVTVPVPVNPSVIKSRGATNRVETVHAAINREAISRLASPSASLAARPLPSQALSPRARCLVSTAVRVVIAVSAAAAAKSVSVSGC